MMVLKKILLAALVVGTLVLLAFIFWVMIHLPIM